MGLWTSSLGPGVQLSLNLILSPVWTGATAQYRTGLD
jgi:hypothetical protein